MDLSIYTGQEASKVQKTLENLGFDVVLKNITNKSTPSSISLVVRAKILENNVIELVCSDFTFLS